MENTPFIDPQKKSTIARMPTIEAPEQPTAAKKSRYYKLKIDTLVLLLLGGMAAICFLTSDPDFIEADVVLPGKGDYVVLTEHENFPLLLSEAPATLSDNRQFLCFTIYNPEDSPYTCTIELLDGQTQIYQSDLLPPFSRIEGFFLQKPLTKDTDTLTLRCHIITESGSTDLRDTLIYLERISV